MARYPIVTPFASGTTNKYVPESEGQLKQGIAFKSDILSNLPNGLANLEQSAIRDLQTMGAFYDNNQVYNTGDVVYEMIQIDRKISIIYFRCKMRDVKGRPPLIGEKIKNPDTQDRPLIIRIDRQDTDTWERVFFETKNKISFRTTPNNNIVVISSQYSNRVSGKLKINTGDVYFDIDFFGKASEFRISNVWYSERVRKSTTLAGPNQVAYIGFCLDVQASGELHLWCNNSSFCHQIEFDYSNLSCDVAPYSTSLNINKPYAIIEGGGVIRQGLGNIITNYRNETTPASGEKYEFYLFKNGYIEWSASMDLDSRYFHQWANGGFGPTNIDVSDRVLRNTGTNATQELGTLLEDTIRNITGSLRNYTKCIFGLGGDEFNGDLRYTGAIVRTQVQGVQVPAYSSTQRFSDGFGFNASKSVPTSSENRMKSLTVKYLIQAF